MISLHRALVIGAFVGFAVVASPLAARAAPLTRHLVRVDVLEMKPGRMPTLRHFDVFVASDGALAQTHAGAYTIGARWTERQEGRPFVTVTFDRVGAVPMHTSGRFRPFLSVPNITFGGGGKGMLTTEVMVTVT